MVIQASAADRSKTYHKRGNSALFLLQLSGLREIGTTFTIRTKRLPLHPRNLANPTIPRNAPNPLTNRSHPLTAPAPPRHPPTPAAPRRRRPRRRPTWAPAAPRSRAAPSTTTSASWSWTCSSWTGPRSWSAPRGRSWSARRRRPSTGPCRWCRAAGSRRWRRAARRRPGSLSAAVVSAERRRGGEGGDGLWMSAGVQADLPSAKHCATTLLVLTVHWHLMSVSWQPDCVLPCVMQSTCRAG